MRFPLKYEVTTHYDVRKIGWEHSAYLPILSQVNYWFLLYFGVCLHRIKPGPETGSSYIYIYISYITQSQDFCLGAIFFFFGHY